LESPRPDYWHVQENQLRSDRRVGRVRKSCAVGDQSAPIPEERMSELGRIGGNSQTIFPSSLVPTLRMKAAGLNPKL
jgi:hypothetical protein